MEEITLAYKAPPRKRRSRSVVEASIFHEKLDALCQMYIENTCEYISKKNANEKLMRQVEEAIGIPEQFADDFRRDVMAQVGTSHIWGKKFTPQSHQRLGTALEKVVDGGFDPFIFRAGDIIDAEFEVRK